MRVETDKGSGVASYKRTPPGHGGWQLGSDRDRRHLLPSRGSPGEGSEVSGRTGRCISPALAGPPACCYDGHECIVPLGGRGFDEHTPDGERGEEGRQRETERERGGGGGGGGGGARWRGKMGREGG